MDCEWGVWGLESAGTTRWCGCSFVRSPQCARVLLLLLLLPSPPALSLLLLLVGWPLSLTVFVWTRTGVFHPRQTSLILFGRVVLSIGHRLSVSVSVVFYSVIQLVGWLVGRLVGRLVVDVDVAWVGDCDRWTRSLRFSLSLLSPLTLFPHRRLRLVTCSCCACVCVCDLYTTVCR